MGPVNVDLVPVLGTHYKNIQWSSQWISDSVQSPEKPYAMELFDLVSKGRMTEAMKVYWQMLPLIDLIYDIQARPLGSDEPHPWQHMKYYISRTFVSLGPSFVRSCRSSSGCAAPSFPGEASPDSSTTRFGFFLLVAWNAYTAPIFSEWMASADRSRSPTVSAARRI